MATPAGIATLDRLNAGVFSVDPEMRIVHWNLFMASNSGRSADEVVGKDLFACFPDLPAEWLRWKLRSVFLLGNFAFSSWRQRPYVFRFPHNRPLTGGLDFMRQDVAFLPVIDDAGAIASVCAMLTDATDAALAHQALDAAHLQLQRELIERERMKDELRMAHKLEAVGQLAAGLAHEINTPIQYIADSVGFLAEAFDEVSGYLETAQRALAAGGQVDPIAGDADLRYLAEHVPAAASRARTGLDRIARLVAAMKEFGQPAQADKADADVNRALETTLTVTCAEHHKVADVVLALEPIAPLACYLPELNQAFLQLIVNAAHAIADAGDARGTITVKTWDGPDAVGISIADTGVGIPAAIQPRIFDPFFTTRPVGKGTGQGLAIARSIVVDRHGGTLSFETAVGRGSTFVVRLPRS
jgi:two-component system NtrC family sensor kinase